MAITPQQKRFLRGKAHALKPVVMVGQHGLNENVLAELEIALDYHELIKVKVSAGDREEKKRIIDAMVAASTAELVQVIGNMAVLFRRNEKKPKVVLPKG